MQLSKTIYFSDYPSTGSNRSGLTIPFSNTERDLYENLKSLSSNSIRRLIGHESYADIEKAATEANMQVASYARKLLANTVKTDANSKSDFFRIQSTFRGGYGSPLHEWYPYLEGYSPEFVENVIETFSPNARDILDPFCGSGTTALVAAMRGGVGYYAEVNPACQYIIEAKSLALTLSFRERARIAQQLHEIAANTEQLIRRSDKAKDLERHFHASFGHRPFYTENTLEAVLRSRSFVDKIEKDDPVVGRFLIIGILRSLVPCSLLVRRGDLRFMTEKELKRGLPDYCDSITESLNLIASDLIDANAAPGRTQFVSDDARCLHKTMSKKVDAIITSPPYLNGTNYFRNTKLELWFLRKVTEKSDLRKFRDSAITSGINDVTRRKLLFAREQDLRFHSPLLDNTINALNETAYDSRIAAMVENYFYDMHDVLAKLPSVLNDNGIIAIDLGDSVYSGVHVPTQDILAEMLECSGFKLDETVLLRDRKSRNGTQLSQTLQVFSPTNSRKWFQIPLPEEKKLTGWNNFKENLPHQQGEMAKRNWGHSWHSLCSYQGKLKPAIARCLVNALMPEKGGRLLDTFSGVGTIPFEARMSGHEAFGFDISPAAVAISRAKLEEINWNEVSTLISSIEADIKDITRRPSPERINNIRFNGPLHSYFHEETLREILVAREFFQENPPNSGSAAFVFSSLLHILHGNRPYALSRRSHPITPFAPSGPTEYRGLIERLNQKVNRNKRSAAEVPPIYGRSYFQDVTKHWPDEVDNLDAIITSPPFFDSTRFHTSNWMRLWFSGWESEDFKAKPSEFIDERQKKTFEVYEKIFEQASERLKTGGVFAIHVGKSKKCDMAAALQQVGERYLKFSDWFSESVEHCERHGIRDKGTVTHHQYLIFEK